MLSFQRWDDNETDIFEFVEQIVPKTKIDTRVISNLHDTVLFPGPIENHIKYCLRTNLSEARNYLLPYLIDESSYKRYEILDCFMKLGGDLSELEKILANLNGDFLYHLIQMLIQKKSKYVKSFLVKRFKTVKEQDEKLQIAKLLIGLQYVKALRYYYRRIRKAGVMRDDSSPTNPLYLLTTINAIVLVLRFYELGFNQKVRFSKYNDPAMIALGGLKNIVLYRQNFKKAKLVFWLYKIVFKVRALVVKETLPNRIIDDLSFYFEAYEQDYYVMMGEGYPIKEAISLYTILKV